MTMKKKGKRIGIIGAGPAGLTAGIIFKQAGYDVKIFDKAPEIVALGGGTSILSTPCSVEVILVSRYKQHCCVDYRRRCVISSSF